jgi:hypothetical protein
MKKVLTALLATGFVVSFAGSGLACTYHSASAEHNMSVAENDQPVIPDEQAVSTHETQKPKLETGEKTD